MFANQPRHLRKKTKSNAEILFESEKYIALIAIKLVRLLYFLHGTSSIVCGYFELFLKRIMIQTLLNIFYNCSTLIDNSFLANVNYMISNYYFMIDF